MLVEAKKVQEGSLVRLGTGEVIKILVSKPETQSSAAGTSTQWYICGYQDGKPTHNIICDPDLELEVCG